MTNDSQSEELNKAFSRSTIEFATVAREYCFFAENAAKYTLKDYVKVASRLLPLLYIKASVLPELEQQSDFALEEYVDYQTYEVVRCSIRAKLAAHDEYLEVFKEDFKYSDSPIVASISEDMADIYQDVRNFCEQYQTGVDDLMNDAIVVVVEKFRTYWGQRLCNALQALHNLLYSSENLDEEEGVPTNNTAENIDLAKQFMDSLDNDSSSEPTSQTHDVPYFLRQTGINLVGGRKK